MPDTITSVVPGSWSIADEMMFYAIFPLLMLGLDKLRFVAAALAVMVAMWVCFGIQRNAYAYAMYTADPAWRAAWGTFLYLWLVQQLPCFLFGMLAFKWMAEGRALRWPAAIVVISVLAMVLVAFFPTLPYIGRGGLPTQYGFIFAIFALGLAHWQPWFLVNPVIGWIGKVSFSAYLVHLWVISAFSVPHANYAEAFAALTAITVTISSVTYLVIEEPLNRLGRRLAKRFRESNAEKRSANSLVQGATIQSAVVQEK
jgi:peptidoglycan/LPS O-acetylase OafA/YrhL